MAASKLIIRFGEQMTVGTVLSFRLGTVNAFLPVNLAETFVVSRSGAGETNISFSLVQMVSEYANALMTDYPSYVTAVQTSVGVLEITATNTSYIFTQARITNGGAVTFEYQNNAPSFTVNNLTGNNYMINNDIIVVLGSQVTGGYFTVRMYNATNGVSTTNIISHQDGSGTVILNLSPIIKGIFSYPKHNTNYTTANLVQVGLNRITLYVKHSSNSTETSFVKNYIRAGRRVNNTNQTIAVNAWLQPSAKIPVWSGYPANASQLASDNTIRIRQVAAIPTAMVDQRRPKGCQSTYVKFLNQLGGYSYWLFEAYTETESGGSLGSYTTYSASNRAGIDLRNSYINDVGDLGSESDNKITVTGKVPTEYIGVIRDLIISPEIYIYEAGSFIRVTCAKNNVQEEANRRAYSVKINFDYQYRFNPSILWSNS